MLPATRGAPFLDPKFAQEHDERISFGHRARVQQPERARNQQPGRLPGRQPARAHASNRNRRAHPGRSQNSDRACTQSVGFMHARVDGWPRMRWYGGRLPGRRAPPNSFEKSAARKLKCARRLRSLASALARARGSEVTQFYWGGRRVHKSEIIGNTQYHLRQIFIRIGGSGVTSSILGIPNRPSFVG